jgi:tetratricopeptide (TPR) repeat protein
MRDKIKSLLQQAELYRSQGLYNESRATYERVKKIIQKSKQLPNREKLLKNISKKIDKVQGSIVKVEGVSDNPQMSAEVNQLIRKLFSQSPENDEHAAALEGAVALAKFGQYNDAIAEFRRLLEVDSQRVQAAKNILRCLIAYKSSDEAFSQLTEWKNDNLFSEEELKKVKTFFEDILDKKWDEKGAARSEALTGGAGVDENDFLDISAVAITLASGEQLELDVSFQSGNVVSLIIDKSEEERIKDLAEGTRLDDVHFYSPIAIFRGSGTIASKTKISSGPKEGDYSMDIKIDSL